MEIFIYLHILLKSKLLQFVIQHQGSFTFHLPSAWPGRVYFLIPSTNDIDAKDTDLLYSNFPAVNEHVGTVAYLARDTQIAADSRSNGPLITLLCS